MRDVEIGEQDFQPGPPDGREDLLVDPVLEAEVGAVREELDVIDEALAELAGTGRDADLDLVGGRCGLRAEG